MDRRIFKKTDNLLKKYDETRDSAPEAAALDFTIRANVLPDGSYECPNCKAPIVKPFEDIHVTLDRDTANLLLNALSYCRGNGTSNAEELRKLSVEIHNALVKSMRTV